MSSHETDLVVYVKSSSSSFSYAYNRQLTKPNCQYSVPANSVPAVPKSFLWETLFNLQRP